MYHMFLVITVSIIIIPTVTVSNIIIFQKEVSVTKDGKKFHSTRVLAKDCSQQYTKADFDDNTSSDVIDDLNDVSCELFPSFPFHHRSISVYLPDCLCCLD